MKGLEDEQATGSAADGGHGPRSSPPRSPPPVKLGSPLVVAAAGRSLKCGRFDGAAELAVSPGIGPRRQIALDRQLIASTPYALRQWTARAHVAWEVNALEDRLLYRVTEVAVFFNVSRSKVYELLSVRRPANR